MNILVIESYCKRFWSWIPKQKDFDSLQESFTNAVTNLKSGSCPRQNLAGEWKLLDRDGVDASGFTGYAHVNAPTDSVLKKITS